MRTKTICGVALLAFTVGGCGGGGDSGSSSPGTLSVHLTDAPVDGASEVVVRFTGLQLHRTDGQTFDLDFASSDTKAIDLIKLQDGVTTALTEDAVVPAGEYDWMRLKVLASRNSQGDSYIKLLNGAVYPLWIPSGAETGLKLNRRFTVAQGSATRLLIDFDLRKSITAPPGQDPNYLMRPTLRALDQLQVGHINATVDLAALTLQQLGPAGAISACKAGLYLFAGSSATPDDHDGVSADGVDPIVYKPVPNDGVVTSVPVKIAFVEAGTYTLAATCNLDVDAADTNDYNPAALQGQPGYQTLRWTTVGNVAVSANNTTALALP